MTTEQEKQIAREQIEHVFGLTGGELADEHWAGHAYWYEDVPSYADELKHLDGEVRTAIHYGLFDAPPKELPADETDADQRPWTFVASFASSGETECPGKHEDVNVVKDEHCNGGDECVLCGADRRAEHGMIYIGDGWCEVVYKREPLPEENES